MEKGCTKRSMGMPLREDLKMDLSTGKEYSIMEMEIIIRESLLTGCRRDLDSISGQKVVHIEETSSKVKEMAMGFGRLVRVGWSVTKAIFLAIRKRGMEFISGTTDGFTRVTSIMIIVTDMGSCIILRGS